MCDKKMSQDIWTSIFLSYIFLSSFPFRVFRLFRGLPLQRHSGGTRKLGPLYVVAVSASAATASAGAADACMAINRQTQNAKSVAIANNTAAVV